MAETIDTNPQKSVIVLQMYPGIFGGFDSPGEFFTPERFAALVFIGYACGTTPEYLNPLIGEVTKNGVPIFLITGDHHTIGAKQTSTYESQLSAIEAGITPLNGVNITSFELIVNAIKQASRAGKEGRDLVDETLLVNDIVREFEDV